MCCMSEKKWQLQIAQRMSKNTSVYCTNVQIVFLLIRISHRVGSRMLHVRFTNGQPYYTYQRNNIFMFIFPFMK
jgi:hypothetical protein